MEKVHELVCEVCSEAFVSAVFYTKCCSDKCRVARWRKTEKGKACVVRGNKRHKRPDIKKVCVHCGKDFISARVSQELCSGCSPSQSAIRAFARFRAKNIEKVRMWGRTSKKAGRKAGRKYKVAQGCSIEGCDEIGDRHHPDYDKPLEIVWLCKKHHVEEHRRLKDVAASP